MALYKSYQITGGEDEWVVAHDTTDFDKLRPTFITVLACSLQIDKTTPKDLIPKAKYFGPLYFDLDSDDIEESITAGKILYAKLQKHGCTETDVEIYLSGKKGLHFVVPMEVFAQKPVPTARLPAIYKEMAYTMAVDTMDFRVYSARRGRMFRTCYNQRENGNWKVQITAAELLKLTPESYAELCSAPRERVAISPNYRASLALLFERVAQNISAVPVKTRKKPDAWTLKKHSDTVGRLMQGHVLTGVAGFNQIALQLVTYAREVHMSEDELISKCAGLIKDYRGDGSRYNSASKREEELRRMFDYVEETDTYEYNFAAIERLVSKKTAEPNPETGEPAEAPDEEICEDSQSNIFFKGGDWFVKNPQEGEPDKHIMQGRLYDISALYSLTDSGDLMSLQGNFTASGRTSPLTLDKDACFSSASFHKEISGKSGLFTGSDAQARYIFDIMLKEATANGRTAYCTTSEGLDVVSIPVEEGSMIRKDHLIYTDKSGVHLPKELLDRGLNISFVPDPGPEAVIKTDLTTSMHFSLWSQIEGNLTCLEDMLEGMIGSLDHSALSRLLGWTTASFFSQLFRKNYGKFPLLHVVGPAGTGKTEVMEGLIRMHYNNQEVANLAAASSIFAIQTTLSASASVPVILDEYKPHTMGTVQLENLRSLLRSSYNAQVISKGGGSRSNSSFKSLHNVKLTGPLVYIAEALETEPALLHRSVLVTLKRAQGRAANRSRGYWIKFKKNQRTLAQVGMAIVAKVINNYTVDSLTLEFDPIHEKATKSFTLQDLDESQDADDIRRRTSVNERVIYNHAVAEFGLTQFFNILVKMLPHKAEYLGKVAEELISSLYNEVGKVTDNSVAEFIKVLITMSDMSKFTQDHPAKITSGLDYDFSSRGGLELIALVPRTVYNKYRMYCRAIGVNPLFGNDASFSQALRDCPVFAGTGKGTKLLPQETILLDYGQLQRNGVDAFAK